MNKVFFITAIKQVDNFTFEITWNDGKTHPYRLSDLQKKCPCAGCQETDRSPSVNEDVRAVRVVSVGRYAIRIEFTAGCSAGIYSYDLLRSFMENSDCLITNTQLTDHE